MKYDFRVEIDEETRENLERRSRETERYIDTLRDDKDRRDRESYALRNWIRLHVV